MLNKRKHYRLDQSPFYKLSNKKRLAELLGLERPELTKLAKLSDSLYSEFDTTKKDGSSRQVENPRRKLKLVQARIARLLNRITPPDYLFCPVKGRSYVTNAAQHVGNRVVRCLDIRKYFPSTSSKRVFWFFHKVMKCELDIAAILTRIACHKQHLPTGSPLSPIMAYYAHFDMWESIATICKNEGYTLTVYIDDVTISALQLTPQVIWDIKKAIHRTRLRYHKEKKYVDRPAEITGVIVSSDTISLPNRQHKKVADTRLALKNAISPKAQATLNARMLGLCGQLHQVETVRRDGLKGNGTLLPR